MKSLAHQFVSGRYSRHVGRVGALAVTLGVGMAVATSPGVAWATPGADGSVDGATSATDTTNTTDVDAESPDPADGESAMSTATAVTTTVGSTPTSQSPSETTQTTTMAPDVIVRSSGGALTSAHYADDPSAAPDEPTTSGVEVDPIAPAPSLPGANKAPEIDTARFSSPVGGPSQSDTSAVTRAVTTDQIAPESAALPMTMFAAAAVPTVPALPTPRAADPVTALLTVPATVIATATKLVAAFLAPLLGPTPGAPAESPLIWTVLAFVRRQFLNDTPTVTSTVSAPDSLGNITISLPRTDADGDQLAYTATNGSKGTVALNPDGHSFTYVPNAGETGFDTLTITANDGTNDHVHGLAGLADALSLGFLGYAGHTSAATTVTVKLNTPPTLTLTPADPDPATGNVTVTMVATDPDDNPLTFTITAPAGGSGTVGTPILIDAATGTYAIVYTPSDTARHTASADTATAAQKAVTVTVTVDDGHGAKLTGTVGVAIEPANDTPVFSTLTSSADAAGKVTGTIAFTDGDGDTLTYSGSTTTKKGGVVVNSDGTFTYTPTDIARNGAAITDGPDVDRFDVTVRDGHGGAVVRTITVDVIPLAVTGSPTAAMTAAALSAVATERSIAQVEFAGALASLAAPSATIDDNLLAALLAQLQATIDETERTQLRSDIDQKLGVTLTDDQRTILAIKAAAVDAVDTGFRAPIFAALDAQALQAATLSPLPPFTNYSPVLSMIVATTDLDTGIITGTIRFVDREGNPGLIRGGVVRVQGIAFDAKALEVNPITGAFVFTPTTGPTIPRPPKLTFEVSAIDPGFGVGAFSGVLDYTASVNVILGPGAGTLAGTTVSVPARTDEQLRDDLDQRIATLESQLDGQFADITAALTATLAAVNATQAAIGRL